MVLKTFIEEKHHGWVTFSDEVSNVYNDDERVDGDGDGRENGDRDLQSQRNLMTIRANVKATIMTITTIAMAMTMTTVLMFMYTLKSTLKTKGGDVAAVEFSLCNSDLSPLVFGTGSLDSFTVVVVLGTVEVVVVLVAVAVVVCIVVLIVPCI